jgi:hypothetical protein
MKKIDGPILADPFDPHAHGPISSIHRQAFLQFQSIHLPFLLFYLLKSDEVIQAAIQR